MGNDDGDLEGSKQSWSDLNKLPVLNSSVFSSKKALINVAKLFYGQIFKTIFTLLAKGTVLHVKHSLTFNPLWANILQVLSVRPFNLSKAIPFAHKRRNEATLVAIARCFWTLVVLSLRSLPSQSATDLPSQSATHLPSHSPLLPNISCHSCHCCAFLVVFLPWFISQLGKTSSQI